MRNYRTSFGRDNSRPFYSDEAADQMCTDALRLNKLLPDRPERIRIDRLVEKHFKVGIVYEPIGDGVLGFTTFGEAGVISVHIDEPSEKTTAAERRVRSTLAHEAGHGLMHAHLFCTEFSHSRLFDSDSDVSHEKVLCREPRSGYDGRWWELQANMAIGALLMPRELLFDAIEPFLESRGAMGVSFLSESKRVAAIDAMCEVFDVNRPVAKFRIDHFFKSESEKQLTL
jgi:hypothetical protein